jgi:hypothetical protein
MPVSCLPRKEAFQTEVSLKVTLVMLLTILIVKVQIQRCIGTVFRNGASPDAQTG